MSDTEKDKKKRRRSSLKMKLFPSYLSKKILDSDKSEISNESCEIVSEQNIEIFESPPSNNNRFELIFTILKCSITTNGLPSSVRIEFLEDDSTFFEIPSVPLDQSIDIKAIKSFNSLTSKLNNENKKFSIIIYKKRWTSSGYKQIGRIYFNPNDLLKNQTTSTSVIKEYVFKSIKHKIETNCTTRIKFELIDHEALDSFDVINENKANSSLYRFYNLLKAFSQDNCSNYVLFLSFFIIIYLLKEWFAIESNMTRINNHINSLIQATQVLNKF